MIKLKIAKDIATMSYVFYIYHEDSIGNHCFAKPLNIEFDEKSTPYGEVIEPTLKIDSRAFDLEIEENISIPSLKILNQKHEDKSCHIKSLENIIMRFIDK